MLNLIRTVMLLTSIVKGTEEVKKTRVHVGIDLGTTFSCVTLHEEKSNEFFQLHFDKEATFPSTIYMEREKSDKGHPIIHYGQKANIRNRDSPSKTNYFYGFKRAMGLLMNDPVIARFRKNVTYVPYSKGGANAIPVFKAEHNDGIAEYTPTDLSALLLGEMHKEIEKNYEIISTVITTPAYFSVNQDSETRKAAEIAGFKEPIIFKEPTAACIEYAQKNNLPLNTEEKILVFDLGGGTFDISVLEVENEKEGTSNNGIFSNISVTKYAGDNFLGGENINEAITAYFKKLIGREFSKTNEELRLRLFVEELKIKACTEHLTNPKAVVTDVWYDDNNVEHKFSLDKETFDKLATPVYDRIRDLFYGSEGLFRPQNQNQSLDKSIAKSDIQKVILVGGSTKIPYIRDFLAKEFKNVEISHAVDPDKSVSIGACRIAANNDGEQSVMLLNATTLPIGIAVSDGSFQAILEKDKTIPTEASQIFSTVEDNQTRISLAVYTGVRPLATQNTLLGMFELTLKEPKPRGVPRIEVKVAMSANYEFSVTATDLDTKETSSKVFKENYVGTDKSKVQEILNAAKEHEVADAELRNKLEQTRLFKTALEMYQQQLNSASSKLSENDMLMFKSIYETYNSWINDITEKTLASEITAELETFKGEAEKLAEAIRNAPAEKPKEDQKEAKEAL